MMRSIIASVTTTTLETTDDELLVFSSWMDVVGAGIVCATIVSIIYIFTRWG